MKAPGYYAVNLVFTSGQTIRYHGELYGYRGRARDKHRRHLFEADSKLCVDFSDHEILDLQGKEQLEVLGWTEAESARLVADGMKPFRNFDSATEAEKAEAQRILKYIRRWEYLGCPPRTQASLAPIIADVAHTEGDKVALSPRTLCRKLAIWMESGGDIDSLLPATSRCGNADDRIDPGLKADFRKHFETYYLADEPESVSAAYSLAKNDWNEAYKHLPEEERPTFPSLSHAYVAAHEVDLFTRDFCREGKAAARRKYAPVDDGPVTKRHNQTWEMDHTTLDVIIIDEETGLPIGRPTITVAIDRHSRAIPAFHVGWDAPGIHCVIECLRKGINRKEALLADIPGVQNPWPVFGVPDEIVTDNAGEFKSKALKEICARLGIEPSRSPVLKAWYRGRIERVIKTLVYSACHTVPGTTYADIFKRSKDRVPEKVAVCTLAQLKEIIARFIVDIYHVRRHRTLNTSPILMYQESVERFGTKPLPDPRKLAITLSLLYFRKPQPKGIVFEELWYHSPELSMYRTLPNVPTIVSVKVDPNDLTRIWFFDTTVNDYVECRIQKSMREQVQGVTLEVHKMARAIKRNNPDLLAGEAGLVKAYAMIRHSLEAQVRGRDGLTNKRRAMRTLSKLRQKAAAMFEDVPDVEPGRQDDMGDELFGPEEPTEDEVVRHVDDEAVGATVSDPPTAAPGPTPEPRAKPRRAKPKAAPPEQASKVQAAPTVGGDDDLDDLDAAMRGNLFVNNAGQENDGV